MADNQREELENEITKLNDEDLDKVAGGSDICFADEVKVNNKCYNCDAIVSKWGIDSTHYHAHCT